MIKRIISRLGVLAVVLFGVTLLTFFYTSLSPVDAAQALAVISDFFMALPPFLVAMTLVGLFESKALSIVISISAAMWVWNAQVVRTYVIREKQKPYVITCRMSGCSELRIIMRHIIPNIFRTCLYCTAPDRRSTQRH